MPGKAFSAEVQSVAADIAAQLGETNPHAIVQLRRVVKQVGADAAYAFLEQTKECLAEGGVLTYNKTRARTPGGTFFYLVRGGVTAAQHQAIWPQHRLPRHLRPADRPLTWAAATEALPAVLPSGGECMSVTLTLIGRPGKLIEKGETLVTSLAGGPPPALPDELPLPPAEPTVYLVFMTRQQWAPVAAALEADPAERLVIEGYPALDKKLGVVGVLAQKVAATGAAAREEEE